MIRLRQVRAEALQEGRLEPRRDILLAPRLGGERLGAGDIAVGELGRGQRRHADARFRLQAAEVRL